jgi:hypothetical protein
MCKKEQRQQLSAILPKTTYNQLKDIAKDEYLSLSALVRKTLVGYVNSSKSKIGKLKK